MEILTGASRRKWNGKSQIPCSLSREVGDDYRGKKTPNLTEMSVIAGCAFPACLLSIKHRVTSSVPFAACS